jgi:alcohol dehydrogenase (cytochrome c)
MSAERTHVRPLPRLLAVALVLAASGALFAASGLDPAQILNPLGDSWPTYSGDYSSRRYSTLSEINQSNVKRLGLAWASRLVAGPGPAVPPPPPPFGPKPSETIVGGVGDNDFVGATVV